MADMPTLPSILVLLSLAHATETHAGGPGDTTLPDPAPASLTGRVLAATDDPVAIEAHPDVATVTVLRGSGRVVSIVPRAGVSPVDLARTLQARPDVSWSHPDVYVRWVPHALPDDPLLDRQWHLLNDGQRGYVPGVDVNAEAAWEITDGTGVIVAVIDSGVDIDHPDLRVIDGHDYIDGDDSSDPVGDENHGTAVAGIIGAIGNNTLGVAGIAHGAEIYGLRLINGTNTLESTYDTFVEAVDAGAAVINNSWGIQDGCAGFPRYDIIDAAYDYAEEEGRDGLGTVVVFSAGNEGCDTSRDGLLVHPAVVGVSAISGFDVRESYSNFGSVVDIGAPSGNIVTTDMVGAAGGGSVAGDPDYMANFFGTSASAPMVSGVVALMIASNPRITASEVRAGLCATAVRSDLREGTWNDQGWSPEYGCGRVDAGAAVRAVANLGPPEPPVLPLKAETSPERVLLQWEPSVEPDGDRVRYRVRWAKARNPNNERSVLVDRPWLDITESVSDGDVVLWRVRGVDLWGPGEWSETQSLSVATPPEPEVVEPSSGCGHLPGTLGWGGLAWLLVRRRRR